MCAPCKIIINERTEDGARMGNIIRELILNPPPNTEEGSKEDNLLYEIASQEVEYILWTRRWAVKYAKMIDAPDRWVKLLEMLE